MINNLEEFLATNFNGGTLVEYDQFDPHFFKEYGRGKIRDVENRGGRLEVVTERRGRASLEVNTDEILEVIKERGVFYLVIPNLYNYAMAPKGVKILVGIDVKIS